jgi:S-(hydroxymethyl)glutathione dehydrogenase / alcohol dehydrogenase
MPLPITHTVAAILQKSSSDLIVDEIALPLNLETGQVLVELISSGLCGAQVNEIDAVKGPDKFLPHLLGHEGYARVLEIGQGVKTVAPGDLVVMHWRPGTGIQSSPPVYKWRNENLNAGWVTTINKHAIVSENRITAIPKSDYNLNTIPLLGCALTTALGVLENDAKATFRDSLLIFGAGGVGMLLIKLAKFIGIREIVVVDIHEEKLSYAINLGSSSTVRFSTKAETMLNLNKIFAGRAPTIAIDTTGNVDAIEICYEISAKEARVILVGVPNSQSKATFYTLPLHFGKVLKGSHGGDSSPERDIPLLINLISEDRISFADYPLQKFKLKEVNDAIQKMRDGVCGRMIIDFTEGRESNGLQ